MQLPLLPDLSAGPDPWAEAQGHSQKESGESPGAHARKVGLCFLAAGR